MITSKLSTIRTAILFPKTRAWLLDYFVHKGRWRLFAVWAFAIVFCHLAWPILRGSADGVIASPHGAALETHIFQGLPSRWLQETLYDAAPSAVRWSTVVIHGSWFVVPWLAVIVVTLKAPDRVVSIFSWWLALYTLALVPYVATPFAPPWMAEPDVIRINELVVGEISDPNPVAAMPSLHVALPLVLSFWFLRERWNAMAYVLATYSFVIGFEVVLAGEHYVVDVLGAVLASTAIAVIARVNVRERLQSTLRLLAHLPVDTKRPMRQPTFRKLKDAGAERAQAILEFVFVLPIMLILIFAIVDFSIAIDRRVMLQHAVREGARYAAVHADCDEIVARTLDQAQDIDDVSVDVSYPDGGGVGERVQVAADFTWEFPIFNELGTALGVGPLSIDMAPSGTARLERTVNPAVGCSGSS